MKKKLCKVFTAFVLSLYTYNFAWATETIRIYSPYSPAHSGTPAMRAIVEQANVSQNIYNFVLEYRPGGNQIIAVRSIDPANSLAIIAPAWVDNIDSGQLNERDYVPIHALGDACWSVVANKPLKGAQEVVVGGVGFGNAAHLTALALGEKYGFRIRYIVFKSNNDALINMAANNGVELVIDKYENYDAIRVKNNRMHMVAASCPSRLPQARTIPTLQELGITAPYIFNITMAHRDMPVARQRAISNILNSATQQVGEQEIFRLSAMKPPVFAKQSDEKFYATSVNTVRQLQKKYREQINAAK